MSRGVTRRRRLPLFRQKVFHLIFKTHTESLQPPYSRKRGPSRSLARQPSLYRPSTCSSPPASQTSPRSARQVCQRIVIALFRDASVLQHHNPIRHPDRRKTVRNKKRHLPRRQFGKALKDFVLAARVQSRRRLVKHQHLRIAQIRTRQRNLLPFTARKIYSPIEAAPQHLVVSFR